MSKRELIEYLQGPYPSINPRHYKGKAGFKILYAIYKKYLAKQGGVRSFILIALLTGLPITSFASDYKPGTANEINISAICMIESGCKDVVGDNGLAIGPYQIHKGVVTDFNKWNGTSYLHSDMHDFQVSSRVADWYLNTEIPRLLKHYEINDNEQVRIIAYNAGIGTLRKIQAGTKTTPDITRRYINKYRELTK